MTDDSPTSRTDDRLLRSRRRRYGRPGRHAGRLRTIRLLAAWSTLVISMVAAFTIATIGHPSVAVAVFVGGAALASRLRRRSARAAVGAAAERLVATHVRRLRAGGIIWGHRPPGRRGDIDLVVLGPWLAAAEIKYGAGRVRVYADGTVRAGRTRLPGHPARQAVGSAAALRRSLGSPELVDAILCVTAMRGRTQVVETDHGELTVTSARRLRSAIRRLPQRTTRSQGRRMAEDLLGRQGSRPGRR